MAGVQLLLCFIVLLRGAGSIQLTSGPADGAAIYICVGSDLQLDWAYTLSAGDAVHDVQWIYDGHSQEMIAIYTHGVFVPTPSYSQRAQHVGTGGLRISHVTRSDSGNYTVEILGVDGSGAPISIRRYVFVFVSDGLLTRDGSLHVTQSAAAVLDADDHWALQLTCDHFIFQDSPPADVQWLSPSGQLMSSTNYADGHFALHLATPITGGRYTCRVTSQNPNSCAHADSEASVSVDVTAARLSLLEAALVHTQAQLSDTKTQLSDTKSRLSQAEGELASTKTQLSDTKIQLSDTQSRLTQAEGELASTKTQLSQRIGSLENRASKTVSFHARYLVTEQQRLSSPIIAPDVITNIGNGYSSSTGIFRAPISGVYFFVAATGPVSGGHWAGMELVVDGRGMIAHATAYDQHDAEQTSVHGVVHLTAGQTVWMRAWNNGDYWSDITTFSGFLITPDP